MDDIKEHIEKIIKTNGNVKLSDISDETRKIGQSYLEGVDLSNFVFDEKPKAFSKLEEPLELVNYLSSTEKIRQSTLGEYISHYTSFSNLEKIMTGKMIYLSNPQNMNDGLEFKSKADCSHLFFASFSLENGENMGMWSMYGQPWTEGVKISFPKKKFLSWQNQISCVYEVDNNTKKLTSNKLTENFKPSISRVAYINLDDKEKVEYISCGDTKNEIIKDIDSPCLAGYIKDSAWSYEREIRLRVDLNPSVNYKCIAVVIPDELIDSMIVTTGPRFEQCDLRRLSCDINKIKFSIFKDKLNYVYCDRCKEMNKNT